MTKEGVGRTGASNFFPTSPLLADMSSHVGILHPTCQKWGNVITHKVQVKFRKIQVRQDKDNIRHNVVTDPCRDGTTLCRD